MSRNLNDWLDHISSKHPKEIELGLERCRQVFQRLFPDWIPVPTYTIAGTNGKGSTVAYLEALVRAADKKTLTFTSPHLFNYRERLTYDGMWLSEAQHIEAFQIIEKTASDIELTFFEISTLSALYWCQKLQPDVLILEVGLGGRLDATNLISADVAIITTVDYDHQEYLGDTLELIAHEKLGVIHPQTTAILADHTVPDSCLENISARTLLQVNRDYFIENGKWTNHRELCFDLPTQIQPNSNSAAAIAAFKVLFSELLNTELVIKANQQLHLLGRYQRIKQHPEVILDVAHNPQAIDHLVSVLHKQGKSELSAVVGMMRDKNLPAVLQRLATVVKHWYFCDLDSPRAASSSELAEISLASGISQKDISCYSSVTRAYQVALKAIKPEESLLVVGSFLTVGPVLEMESQSESK